MIMTSTSGSAQFVSNHHRGNSGWRFMSSSSNCASTANTSKGASEVAVQAD
jgi:hypothetical protein